MRSFELIALVYLALSFLVLGAYEYRKHHERVECMRVLKGRADPETVRLWCAEYVRKRAR